MVCLLTAIAGAQSPLTTTFASNNVGSVGGMVFFDLQVMHPAGITVKQLDIHTTSSAGELRVYSAPGSYLGIAASPAAWNQVATAGIDAAGLNQPTVVCLGAGFFLPFGNHALALSGETLSMRYTAGATVPLAYSNAELTLTAGAASSVPFGGAQFSPRVWNGNVHYDLGATMAFSCAYTTSLGAGCGEGATSWYEWFADMSAFDQAGTVASPVALRATAIAANGYAVIAAPPVWHVPVGPRLHDNQTQSPGAIGSSEYSEPLQLPFVFPFPGGATSVVHASGNGWLLLAGTSSQFDFALPNPTNLLTQAPRLAPFWSVLDPSGNDASNPVSGVYFDVAASGQAAYITWLDVADARTGVPPAGTSSVNVQCVLYQNGDYEFRYGEIVPSPGVGPVLMGWSQGGGQMELPDPGGIDASSQIPWITNGPDNFALEHACSPARLGASVVFEVQRVEPVLPVAILLVGDAANPSGVSLAAVGAPGCRLFTNVLATATVPVTAATGSGGFALAIPSNPALLGSNLVSQYVALTLRNALNISTSNAVSSTIGI